MILEIKNINKSFGDKQVLHDVSFSVKSGNPLGFLGRNGSGKTTTIRIIMKIISMDSGELLIDGMNFSHDDFKMGYLPEERGLYQKVSVLEQMIYFGKLKGMTADSAKKSALLLLEKLEATDYIKMAASNLSKGNQQKIQLAIALLNDPDILILDEPFSGLDPVNAKVLREVVEENARLSKIILFSSHQLDSVEEFCEDVCLINNGSVILFGNLWVIKDAYPQEKILVIPDKHEESHLKKVLDTDENVQRSILDYTHDKNGFIITLNQPDEKASLLHTIAENVSLRSFSTVEPSLLDIFLEKAGGPHEEN